MRGITCETILIAGIEEPPKIPTFRERGKEAQKAAQRKAFVQQMEKVLSRVRLGKWIKGKP